MRDSDYRTLFRAVLANPADDFARLVFADCLDESSHPALAARAGYIRLQVEAARRPHSDPVYRKLMQQSYELRPQFEDEVDAILKSPNGRAVLVYRERGFVDSVRSSSHVLGEFWPRLADAAPVTGLHVEDFLPADAGWVAESMSLAGVRHLKVGPHAWVISHADDSTGAELLRSPSFHGVAHLDLAGNHLDDRWVVSFVTRLADSPLGRSLKRLDLSRNALGDRSASFLASAAFVRQLDELVLRRTRVSPDHLDHLARALHPTRVVHEPD